MRESEIESWSKALARRQGWYVRKFKSPGNNAVPDDIFMKGGHAFFVEFKATGKCANDLQLDEHLHIAHAGFHTHVVDSREQFKEVLAWEEGRVEGETSA